MTTPSRSESSSARASALPSTRAANAPPPETSGPTPPQRRPWSIEDLREIVAMAVKDGPSMLRETDRRGLAPVQYAALQAATAADSLLPLLSLLEPPQAKETSQLDQIVTLLETIAESQVRTERRLVELESRLAGRASALPPPSKTEAAASQN